MSVEELLGKSRSSTGSKRGQASRLTQQVERIGLLPKTKQHFVMEMLDTVLARASR